MLSPSQLSLVASALLQARRSPDFLGYRPQPHPACCRRRDYLFQHRHSGAAGVDLEFCVALMLVLLGVVNLRVAMRSMRVDPVLAAEEHEHVHRHGDYVHTHAHGHESGNHGHNEDSVPPARLDRIFGRVKWYRGIDQSSLASCMASLVRRRRAPCPAHYSATHLGPGLPHRFWLRHRHGHDVDDGDDRGAHRLHCSF